MKVKAKTIEITFTEAGDRYRGTFETWIGADIALDRIARNERGPGCSKTFVTITWADGEQYEARLDIAAGSAPSFIGARGGTVTRDASRRGRRAHAGNRDRQGGAE